MDGRTSIISVISASQFAQGLLAGLAAMGRTRVGAAHAQLCRAFRNTADVANAGGSLRVDVSVVDYDPLYQVSEWLDDYLARQMRDLVVRALMPPEYGLVIEITRAEGERLLSSLPEPERMRALAAVFAAAIGV